MTGVVSSLAWGLAWSWAALGQTGPQEPSEELRRELEALRREIRELKSEKESPPARDEMKLGDDRTILDILLEESKLTGFVDVGVVWNFDRPDNGVNGNVPAGGSVRAFDRRSRSFYLHNAQLSLRRDATKELITGYNIELTLGSDANVIAPQGLTPTGLSANDDYFDLQEANIQILAPVGSGLDIRIGKFATLSGYEVIESKDNYNYSRSLPFLFAIPFTHTGVRASYQAIETVKLTLGINNGWDSLEDNNDAKTLEFQALVTPTPWLTLSGVVYYGAEKSPTAGGRDPGDKRWLIDLVATVSNIPGLPGWTFGANLDLGEEEASSVTDPGDDASWTGLAFYAKWQINESWAVAARYSLLDDSDAFRTGGFLDPISSTFEENRLSEITLTVEYRISKDTIARLEFRHDLSDEDVFLDHLNADDSQSTLGAEFILVF